MHSTPNPTCKTQRKSVAAMLRSHKRRVEQQVSMQTDLIKRGERMLLRARMEMEHNQLDAARMSLWGARFSFSLASASEHLKEVDRIEAQLTESQVKTPKASINQQPNSAANVDEGPSDAARSSRATPSSSAVSRVGAASSPDGEEGSGKRAEHYVPASCGPRTADKSTGHFFARHVEWRPSTRVWFGKPCDPKNMIF